MTSTGGPSERTHRADIQGLRALAVVLVVLFHADFGFSGGFIGVDVFFVISGFVITNLLTRELDGTGGLRLGRFYLRRIRRLVPALALVLVGAGLLAILAAPVGVQPIAARTGAAASVFLGNFYLYSTPHGYFALDANLNPFLHTWSLAVEEQFYLVFPLLLFGAWRLGARARRSRPTAIAVLSIVGLASFGLSVAMVKGHAVLPGVSSPREFAFYSSFTRAWEFAAGALLALAVVRLRRLPPAAAMLLGVAGFAAILWPALRFDDLTPFPGLNAVLPVLGTVLLLAAGTDGAVGLSRALGTRPAVFVGDISYSWYLWHWPLIVYARALWPGSATAPVAAAVSIVPAYLSYRFVENPIRRNERLTPRRTLTIGATGVLVGILACGGLVLGHRWVVGTSGYRSVQQALRTHRVCPVRGQGRAGAQVGDPEVAVRCTWDVPGSTGTVALLGDSNAGHLSEAVVQASKSLDHSVYAAVSNGCPFADVTMVVLGDRRADCRRFYEESVRTVEQQRPAVVVIGSTTTRYIREGQFGISVGTASTVARTPSAKLAAWQSGLRRTVARLSADGIHVVVVHPIPKYPGWDLRGCAAGRIALSQFTCGRSTSRAHAIADGASALAAEQRAIHGVAGVTGASFLPQLCTPTTCATDLAHVWLYHDGDHLSIRGSQRLTPRFRTILQSAIG
ncbi:MAG: acyltransferase family protein [Acidimicrobiia bacterium]